MQITRVGDFTLGWGESLVWDDQRARLYFADCVVSSIHWLDDGEVEPHTVRTPSMPAGLVPTDDGRLVAVLEDGLAVVDPDTGTIEALADYPDALGGRGNDACADGAGNLITGRLNLGPDEGSAWWFSRTDGWRLLDPDISNTNGPAVGPIGGRMTLIIGDTAKDYFAYDYEPETGAVGTRRVFGDTSGLDGHPDGATLDADGGLWCALFAGAQLARFTDAGLDRTVAVPVANPTDVTFGGPDLDRLYVTSIGPGPSDSGGAIDAGDLLDGALLVVDGLGPTGRPEPRFALAG